MLDPVKNAKVIGYLFLILALLDGIPILGSLNDIGSTALILISVDLIATVAIAFGLIKTKLWAVYGIGGLIAIRLIEVFYNYSLQVPPTKGTLVTLAIFVLLFVWFYSARGRFSK